MRTMRMVEVDIGIVMAPACIHTEAARALSSHIALKFGRHRIAAASQDAFAHRPLDTRRPRPVAEDDAAQCTRETNRFVGHVAGAARQQVGQLVGLG